MEANQISLMIPPPGVLLLQCVCVKSFVAIHSSASDCYIQKQITKNSQLNLHFDDLLL